MDINTLSTLALLMYLDEGLVTNLSSLMLSGYINIRTTNNIPLILYLLIVKNSLPISLEAIIYASKNIERHILLMLYDIYFTIVFNIFDHFLG